MSKIINQSIHVEVRNGLPTGFFYHQFRRIERIQDFWREQGRWWMQENELHVFRVTTQGSLYELHHVPLQEQWLLYRIFD